jgi:GntR family transcriptional regulator / MocR family aminotransferase
MITRPVTMDFAIVLDPASAIPLHRQLYEALRQAIISGRLTPGQQVLSTRQLAKSLKISRSTVLLSYEQLLDEGYLKTIPASGTFVSRDIPDVLLQPVKPQSPQPTISLETSLSTYGARLAKTEFYSLQKPELPINFNCYGRPALDEFPIKLWRRLLSRSCSSSLDILDYPSDPLGYRPLREAIARYLIQSRAVQCQPEQVIVVNGSQQGIDLIARLLLDRGEWVAMEEPGYFDARNMFLAHGAKLLPIFIDECGMVVEQLVSFSGEQVKLVYTTPSHQFPTGTVLSLPRRMTLLAWAKQTGAIIIEDDYDSEYRYSERPIPALQGLTPNAPVIYVGTFSKVLFPSLRIGYLVVPQNLVSMFARAKWSTDRQSPLIEQFALTDFISEGYLESHIRRMRMLYGERRKILVQALQHYLGKSLTIVGENAGMHLMARCNTEMDNETVVHRAAQRNISLTSTQIFYSNPSKVNEFVFGYASLRPEQIVEGVRQLTQCLTAV